jgi:hypothetical protein
LVGQAISFPSIPDPAAAIQTMSCTPLPDQTLSRLADG